jgi:hypothetical protein
MTTADQLRQIAPSLAALFLAIALLASFLAMRLFRKSRKDGYWRARRSAGQRGWRLFILAAIMFVGAVGMCSFSAFWQLVAPLPTRVAELVLPSESAPTAGSIANLATDSPTSLPTNLPTDQEATDLPTIAPTIAESATASLAPTRRLELPTVTPFSLATLRIQTSTPAATATATASITASATLTATPSRTFTATATFTNTVTPSPTFTATATATPSATATFTATATATVTPSATFVPLAVLMSQPLEASTTPIANITGEIYALATALTADSQPLDPALSFKAGFTRLYYFGRFTGMARGILWRRELWHEGRPLQSREYLWGEGGDGAFFFFFGQPAGFAIGQYQIKLFIGRDSQTPFAEASFSVVGQ